MIFALDTLNVRHISTFALVDVLTDKQTDRQTTLLGR